MPFKSGYVALLGVPNAGKSTLLNALLTEKLAAVCDKPQTTRKRFKGILNSKSSQIIFLDTPGIHTSEKKLNQFMHSEINEAINDADVLCFLIPVDQKLSAQVEQLVKKHSAKQPLIFLTKCDLDKKMWRLDINKALLLSHGKVLPVSAVTGSELKKLVQSIEKKLPEGQPYYPIDELTDVNMRDIAAEIIREKIMELTHQEIPYSTAVVIESYKDPELSDPELLEDDEPTLKSDKPLTRIEATIIVEQDSQKGIVIGKSGALIKQIGSMARSDLEQIVGNQVFLGLNVKVDKNWTKNPSKLKQYGYSRPNVK